MQINRVARAMNDLEMCISTQRLQLMNTDADADTVITAASAHTYALHVYSPTAK